LLRCDEIQGYFFSKPLPAETFVSLFEPQMNADYTDQKKQSV
jgi:EAL domain-containing protein (putative c-di-GMP-specific phosphodiesterase class I)